MLLSFYKLHCKHIENLNLLIEKIDLLTNLFLINNKVILDIKKDLSEINQGLLSTDLIIPSIIIISFLVFLVLHSCKTNLYASQLELILLENNYRLDKLEFLNFLEESLSNSNDDLLNLIKFNYLPLNVALNQ